MRLRLRRHRRRSRGGADRRADTYVPARGHVVRRAWRRAAAARSHRWPQREPRRGRGRGHGDWGQARAPLVYGLGQTSCEASRRAVALAETIGAAVDPRGQRRRSARSPGDRVQYRNLRRDPRPGRARRAWRADPAVTHPRLLGRLRLDPAASRSSSARGARPPLSGRRVRRGRWRFEALWALRAPRCAPLARDRELRTTTSAQRLLGARHVALIHGALDEPAALALFALARDLSRDRHAVTLGLRADGNGRGAEDVLAGRRGSPWRSASPAATRARTRARRRAARTRRGRCGARRRRHLLEDLRPPQSACASCPRWRRCAGDRDFGGGAGRLRHGGRRHRVAGYHPSDGRRAGPPARAAGRGAPGRRECVDRDRRAPLMSGSPPAACTTPPTASTARCETSGCNGKIVADVPAHARRIDAPASSSCPAASTCIATSPARRSTPPASSRPRRNAPKRSSAAAIAQSGTIGSVPSTFATGYKYALLGYTTAFDAATPPLAARHTHEEIRRHALHRQGLLHPDGQQPTS